MVVNINQTGRKLPDFFIVGAPRSGTTTLYSCLSRHPRIFMPAEKEPTFFLAWGEPPFYKDSRFRRHVSHVIYQVDDYLRLFRAARESDIIGEASALYLHGYRTVIPNIRRMFGYKSRGLKIIISLRNPVDRAWSHYCLKRSHLEEHLDFAEAIEPETIHGRRRHRLMPSFDYTGAGMYSDAVNAYLENFQNVKILLLEDIAKDLDGTISALCAYLGLETNGARAKTARWNASGLPKNEGSRQLANFLFRSSVLKSVLKPLLPRRFRWRLKFSMGERLFSKQPLDGETRRKLLGFYRDDILRLEKLIGRDLQHWLRTSGPQAGTDRRPKGL